MLDPETLTIPPWKGYAKAIPFRNLINHALTYFRTGDGFGCIVLELIDGVTLKEYIRNMSPLQKDVELRDVVRQLLMGKCHQFIHVHYVNYFYARFRVFT
jgi:serine/threonine protein kinase